ARLCRAGFVNVRIVTFAPWQRFEFTTTGQLPCSRQSGSNPQTGSRKSLRWFPLMPDTFCLFQCSPARKLPANAGTLDYIEGLPLSELVRTPRKVAVSH